MKDLRLSVRNLNKSYNVPVLKNVNLSIGRGEIHAIVGENGAGKSTLINVLTGLTPRDSGSISLDGESYEPNSAGDGFAAGVSFTSQELSIVESLTVAENIFLRYLPRHYGIVDTSALHASARALLDRVGLDYVATDSRAESLSLADRQLLEFAKAINAECRLLLLDEPTAALTEQQAERVHAVIREIAAHRVSVIYISHRLDDVLDVSDTVTVLRDGAVISTTEADASSAADLVSLMTGGGVIRPRDLAAADAASRPALVVENLCTENLPHSVNLTCHESEIVGIAGLAGAGKSELLRAMFRLDGLHSGRVIRHIKNETNEIQSARHAVRNGIGFLGENRQTMGIFPGQAVLTNMMLPDILRSAACTVDATAEKTLAGQLGERLAIRCNSLQQDIRELSGGNQQKVLIARWLNAGSAVLLLDEPTRGVDVGTKQAIYELLFELRSNGNAIVIASSELDELMTVCDRILVLSNRHLVAEFNRGHWSEEQILSASFSAYTDSTTREVSQSEGVR